MGNLALPGNPRYQPKDLQSVFGYDNLFRAVAEVEIATLKTLAEIGIIPAADAAAMREAGVDGVYTPKDFEINRIMSEIADLVSERHRAAQPA